MRSAQAAGLAAAVLLATGCALLAGPTPRRASPRGVVRATIDGAPIVVEYGRPFRRDRTIFGGLVPYGRIWRTGADEATVLQTAVALRFGGDVVPPGRYSIWTLPGRRRWLFIINRRTGQWGTDYDPLADLVRVPVVPVHMRRPVDQFTIRVRTHGQRGQLTLSWARTRVVVPFSAAPATAGSAGR